MFPSNTATKTTTTTTSNNDNNNNNRINVLTETYNVAFNVS